MKNRSAVKAALKTLLEAVLVNGSPQLAQAVHSYQNTSFGGVSPIVLIYSGGSVRPRATLVGHASELIFWIDVYVTVEESGSYTKEDAEDRLDLIEKTIAETIETNYATSDWNSIVYDAESTIIDQAIEGTAYLREMIPVRVGVFG